MNQGTAAALIAQGLIALFAILDMDNVKSQFLEVWMQKGKTIIILKGYDHKHLKYLKEEVKYTAIGTHAVRESWGRNRAILTLAVFGLREELEEAFDGLSLLR
ncbi:uncharacterized protein LOC143363022 [Halictus rubicundus]|uniref:uncharacterized protein LOC143363022 n=1 Tax=Halictus rubicundus TaxID=77578 RepID=UPI004036BACD